MGRLRIISAAIIIFMMATVCTFADTPISGDRISVTNLLPDVNIYMDTDQKYKISEKNTQAFIDEKDTDIQSVERFKESGEGVVYFILVDVSKSISEEDFEAVKSGIIAFGDMLSSDDKVYLIPFGESVYPFEDAFDPSEKEFSEAVEGLERKDNYTQLYTAVDSIVTTVDEESSFPKRNIAIVFTDGAEETTGGQITADEARNGMMSNGIPLYGFAVGDDKEGKDSLGVFCRSLNGSLSETDKTNIDEELTALKDIIDNTVVIKTKAKNSEDIVNDFDLRIRVDGTDIAVKKDITAYKSEDSHDVFSVALKKLILEYWWIIVIAAVALIAAIVLTVIKRNRGIVNIDGKVVYGSRIERKYHVQVREHNTKQLKLTVNINGGKPLQQEVTIVESIIVGRSSMCDVYFDDIKMSRQHFSIEVLNDELYITDLESTGGTYLNGVKIYMKQRLNSGDIVSAGKTKIRIDW